MPIPYLPLEIIVYILTFISSPADLLSTSLTNRTISAFSLPELNYRFIRSGLSNNALWIHLITHPDLAAYVRELEIMREDACRWRSDERDLFPRDISTVYKEGYRKPISLEDVERSEKLLIAALRVLVNLEKFTWKHSAPVVIQGKDALLEVGGVSGIKTYKEDVWTALRDYTPLRELKLADKGPGEYPGPNVRGLYSLYNSQMGSIRNITCVDLKIRNNNESDGADVDSDNDDIDVTALPPGHVKISVLCSFLIQCYNLEHLILDIHDRHYSSFGSLDRILSTNLSRLFISACWPRLSTLHLTDICADNPAITKFLIVHSHIRSFFASLSVMYRGDIPKAPFSLDLGMLNERRLIGQFLPELEEVDLPPELARDVLRVVKNLGGLKVVKTLEQCDWGVLDEYRTEKEEDKAAAYAGVNMNTNLLKQMTSVRVLTVRNMGTGRDSLGILADVTPRLEVLELVGRGLNTNLNPFYVEPVHTQLLPHLTKWRYLKSFTGLPLWEGDDDLGTRPESVVVRELAEACPLLKEVTWKSRKTGFLVRDETGKGIRMDVPYLPSKVEILW